MCLLPILTYAAKCQHFLQSIWKRVQSNSDLFILPALYTLHRNMFHLEREKALVCAVKKSFDCVNCQNEILIVSESVKYEPLSSGDKEAAGSSDILWREAFHFHFAANAASHTKPDNINTVINKLEKPCSHVHVHYTNLLHDELRLHDRSTKRSIWSTDFIESFSIHWSPISAQLSSTHPYL